MNKDDGLESFKVMFTALHIEKNVRQLLSTLVDHEDVDGVILEDKSVLTLREVLAYDTSYLNTCVNHVLQGMDSMDRKFKTAVAKFLKPLIIDDEWKKKRKALLVKATNKK